MLIYDILHKEKIYHVVTSELKNCGVKYRFKKNTFKNGYVDRNKVITKKIFETSLTYQPLDVVNLSSGGIVHVPVFVSQAIAFLEHHVAQEGLFRKAGSRIRQKEIIARLDVGEPLSDQHHVIDIANCLKTFFRSLPEPLIPYVYHDLFVHCCLLKTHRTEAILLACLLLPPHHLNTLAFLMEFLKKVSLDEKKNKMNSDNLAKVVGPNIMPLQETTIAAVQSRLDLHLLTVKILIDNAEKIGILPDHFKSNISMETIGSTDNELDLSDSQLHIKSKRKKHRSGSLTRKPPLSASNLNLRVFNGLRKIVGKGGSSEEFHTMDNQHLNTDTHLLHGSHSKISKKRKVHERLDHQSMKKKGLPDKLDKSKKMRLSLDRLVSKKHKSSEIDLESNLHDGPSERRWSSVSDSSCKKSTPRYSDGSSHIQTVKLAKLTNLELRERYDDVFVDADVNLSNTNSERDSLENCDEINQHERLSQKSQGKSHRTYATNDILTPAGNCYEEYVKIPKSEYEEIKNRVSAIESRISQEFGSITNERVENVTIHSARDVQTEYEKTLEEASVENTLSADHLARRLGRELKIRRSAEHKIIRSPSARKIGNLRRRSQEKTISKRINRSASWHVSQGSNMMHRKQSDKMLRSYQVQQQPLIAEKKREYHLQKSDDMFCSEETNARLDFLQKQLSALISHTTECKDDSLSDEDPCFTNKVIRSNKSKDIVRRASSFHGNEFINDSVCFKRKVKQSQKTKTRENSLVYDKSSLNDCSSSEWKPTSIVSWKDADSYFKSSSRTNTPVQQTGRASIAKLRTQNAGMVLAKAKLFDDNTVKASSNRQNSELQSHVMYKQIPKNRNLSTFVDSKLKPDSRSYDLQDKSETNNSLAYRSHNYIESSEMKNTRINYEKENVSISASPLVRKVPIDTVLCDTSMDNSNISSLCRTPHIKRPLSVKTPKSSKSLVRRPAMDTRRTPLKAVAYVGTSKHQSPKSILKMRNLHRNVT